MEILSNLIDGTIVCAPEEFRSFFAEYKSRNIYLDFKFVTKETMLTGVFGDIGEDGLIFALHHSDYSYQMIKTFFSYIKNGIVLNQQTKEIADFKALLEKNNLIYTDKNYKTLLRSNKILFFGYSKNDGEIEHLISECDLKNFQFCDISELFDGQFSNYISFDTLIDELHYAYIRSSELLAENKKIKFICDTNNYKFFLDLLGNSYGICNEYKKSLSLYDTNIGKFLLKHLDDGKPLSQLIEENKDKFPRSSAILEQFNKVLIKYDFDNLKDKYNNFQCIFKSKTIKNSHKTGSVIYIQDQLEFDPTYRYFYLGVNEANFPTVSQDSDYLDDEVKKVCKLTTSLEENEERAMIYEAFLKFQNLEKICFHKAYMKNKYNLPQLFNKLGIQKVDDNEIKKYREYDYSKDVAYGFYSREEELISKYKKETPEYFNHYSKFGKIIRYDNSFKGINRVDDKPKKYSFTQMNLYYECPFKYYCQYILFRGDPIDETMELKFGNYAHKVLENVYDRQFDLDNVAYLVKKNFQFTYKEEVFLERLNFELKYVVDLLRERATNSEFSNSYSEESVNIAINDTVNFEGKIDSIVETANKYLFIIDYKTGDFKNKPQLFEYSLGLQLPCYVLLVKECGKFNLHDVCGIFFQPLRAKSLIISYQNDYLKAFKMQGICIDSEEVYRTFDLSIENGFSKFTCVQKAKNKELTCSANMDYILSLADIAKQSILNLDNCTRKNEFDIKPTIIGSVITPCEYCQFKDICYVKDSQKKVIRLNADKDKTANDTESEGE